MKLICEYCGTQFREERDALKVEIYRPGVHTLGATAMIDKDFIARNPREAAEIAIKEMSKSFAEGIAQFMEVKTREEFGTGCIRFAAKLRVLDSEYRF